MIGAAVEVRAVTKVVGESSARLDILRGVDLTVIPANSSRSPVRPDRAKARFSI